MANTNCPFCDHPIAPKDRHCGNCGVDLALVTILTEESISTRRDSRPLRAVKPEILVPKLGEYLVRKGLLNESQINKALNYQKVRSAQKNPILLGEALVQLNFIDQKSLDQAITEQIIQLQQALKETNRDLEKRVQKRTSELEKALDRLTELSHLKNNFVSNISHELRTPLTHIKGYIELLLDETLGPTTKEQFDALIVLERATGRLETLIENLIQFSEASQGDLSLSYSYATLREIINKVILQSYDKAETKKIQLHTSLANDVAKVYVDAEKIVWVLDQLLDNAIKFTPTGGKVNISAKTVNNYIVLTVTDTGIGIPDERMDEIFEAFHQLDGSATRRYGGTGLGLALVKRILEAHGSEIKVRSKVGKGTQFEFKLPKNQLVLTSVNAFEV